jgi:uncharacterized iron-regulated membrane protein
MALQTSASKRPIRRFTIKLHRWMGIGAAAFWLVQALTGVLLTFHFEIEDAVISAKNVPTDLAAIERRIDAISSAGGLSRVKWMRTTAGLPDRYSIAFVDRAGTDSMARIDGAGNVLHHHAADDLGFIGIMRELHFELLSGHTGQWILGISGGLLVSNLIVGLAVAWPRKGWWKSAIIPSQKGGATARMFSWHRSLGLWAAIPAVVMAGSGTLILFQGALVELLAIEAVDLPVNSAKAQPIGFEAASRTAVAAIPGSAFVGTRFPTEQDASYHVWIRAPGELYRSYGASVVVIDANDASVREIWSASEATTSKAFLNALYPVHTGEAAGLAGRILAIAIGAWLVVVTVTGCLLWLRRRPRRKPAT